VYKLQQKNSREAGSDKEKERERHLWDAAEWDQIDSTTEVNLKAQK
jgi:hypothetical protein